MTKPLEILPPKKVKIIPIPGKGLGVVATETILAGELIEKFPIIYLSAKDANYFKTESDVFKFYPMELENYHKHCVMFGYGSIYNHDHENPNADIFYPEQETDRYLSIKALKDIMPGEEITYDYEFDNNQADFLPLP